MVSVLEPDIVPLDAGGEFCAMVVVLELLDAFDILEFSAGAAVLFGVMPPWLPA